MQIKRERIIYGKNQKVWIGKYLNSQNLPHWHYDCELLYVEKGKLSVMCDSKVYSIEKGQTFFIDSGQLHYISATRPDSVLMTFFFSYDLIKPFASDIMLSNPNVTQYYGICETYSKIKEQFEQCGKLFETRIALLMTDLILKIFANEATEKRTDMHTTQAFKNLLSQLHIDYEFSTFDSAVEIMGMNASYFSRYFHNLAGMTFTEYLNYIKVSKAVELIQSEKKTSITDISIRCGFTTIRSFNRVFKKLTGYTPTNLPDNFILGESFLRNENTECNPTLGGCTLIESYN